MNKNAPRPAATTSKYPDADVPVPGLGGGLDLGHIHEDAAAAAMAKEAGEEQPAAPGPPIPAGPVRLPYGIPEPWGFGLQHVEANADRVRAIKKMGFPSVLAFICDVAANWTHMVRGKDGKLLLVWQRGGYDLTIVVGWKGAYWSVVTALSYRVAQGVIIYEREK